jgi:hypothetical protein
MRRRPHLWRAFQHAAEAFVLQLARDIEDFRHWEDHGTQDTGEYDEPKMGFS